MSTRAPGPVCILNDTRVDRHHGCERVMSAIETLVSRNGMQVIGSCPAHADWRERPEFLRAMEAARLVIVNGEGTIHHDRPAGRRLLEIGARARAAGIPAVLVNAGWEANGPELLAMLKDFALVSLRDSASAEAVRASGQDCRVVPDLSLYGSAPQATGPARERIVFTDSVDRFKAVDLERCRREVGGDTLSIVFPPPGAAGYLRFLRQGFAARDALTPARLMRIVRLRHRLCRNSYTRTEPFLSALGRYRLLVSGRFHACTLALITGTPFVSVPSNTGKIATLVRDAGLQPWRASTRLDARSIAEASAAGWSAQEREAIEGHVTRARADAERLFQDIRGLA
jgi:polysaccharide pyruvyl transferase WcaK-like protein